jgi:hypothetical protein
LTFGGVVLSHVYNKKPYQLLFNIKTFYNQELLIPGIENLLPGKIIYNFVQNIEIRRPVYLGSQITLEKIPYYIYLNFLTNNFNNK